jgi:hypothetical protein
VMINPKHFDVQDLRPELRRKFGEWWLLKKRLISAMENSCRSWPDLTISEIGALVLKQLSFESRNKSSLESRHWIPPSTTSPFGVYLSRERWGISGFTDGSWSIY